MKKKVPFNEERALYGFNKVFISRVLDPYTVKVAKWAHYLRITGDLATLITFITGMAAVLIIILMPNYKGLIIAGILITLRNIGDTVDGKLVRGSGIKSTYGGFSDIIADWLFFHAAFFIAIGYAYNHVIIGFLCVTGYMSREFARRMFKFKSKLDVNETVAAKKMPTLTSLLKTYELANVFWIAPIFLFLNQAVIIIFAVAIIEYTLLFGEIGYYYYCFVRKQKEMDKEKNKEENKD